MRFLNGHGVNRRRFLTGTAATGATLTVSGLFAPALAANKIIKLGFVTPKSGPLSLFSEADDFIFAGARAAFANGLTVTGKTHPVEIVAKDSQSNPNRALEVAAELIGEGVEMILVSSAPETVNPVSDQCGLNGVPRISTVAPWRAWMFNRGGNPGEGFEYTYHFFWGLEDIRDSEKAAGSLGVNTQRTKLIVFVAIAAVTAGLGAIVILIRLRVTPDSAFSLVDWNAFVLFIVVIGGIGHLEGPIIGTVIFFLRRSIFADYGVFYLILLGGVAILVMLKAPTGIWGKISGRWGGIWCR